MYGLYDTLYLAIYYIPFFIILAIFIWLIYKEKRYLEFSVGMDRTHWEDQDISVEGCVVKIKRYTLVFIVVIILFLPAWSFSVSEVTETDIRNERFYLTGGKGTVTGVRDPVKYSIGPTYDIEKVKSKMEEGSNRWVPDQLEEHLDLDELTDVPGRLGIYWLRGDKERPERYVVSYTYLGPYPVVDLYGFKITGEGTDLHLEYVGEQTFIYPEKPSIKPIYGSL